MRLEVRRANLDDDLRDLFEQYGEQVVAMALALGSNQGTGLRTHPVAPTHAMNVVHANQEALRDCGRGLSAAPYNRTWEQGQSLTWPAHEAEVGSFGRLVAAGKIDGEFLASDRWPNLLRESGTFRYRSLRNSHAGA